MQRAAIYTRVSSREQVDKYSLSAQEKILKECIEKAEQKLIEVYSDPGISGERIIDRPDFLRLLNDAEQKKFDCVWVVDQDRLSRGDLADLAFIKKTFKESSIKICTPYQQLTLSDVDDDFISDMYGILAKRERLKIVERANRGRNEKASRGEWHGSTSPFGYDFDMEKSKFLIANQHEKQVYLKIIDLFLNRGMGVKRIADELNKQGYKNRHGKWAHQSVNYILKNPVYKGFIVHQKFKQYIAKKSGKKRFQDVKNFKLIKSQHEAFITQETFELIQRRIKQNRSQNRTYLYMQLLTNILECPKCHNSFKVGMSGAPGYRKIVYRCKTRFSHWFDKSRPHCSMRVFGVDELNERVWKRLQEIASQPGLIEDALRDSCISNEEVLRNYREQLQGICKSIDEFKSYKDNAVSLRVRNKISEDEFESQMLELETEHETFKRNRKELEIKIEHIKRMSEGIDKEAILRYARFIYQSDRKLSIEQKRKILEDFVSRVLIQDDGEFEFVLKFPLLPGIPAKANFNPASNPAFKPAFNHSQPIDFATTSRGASDGAITGRYLKRSDPPLF